MSQPGPPGISTAEPFLVLPENRFAYTAVTGIGNATAEPPPVLYLYGPSGTGKSHLARHAAWLLLRQQAQARVVESTASEWANELAVAASTQKLPALQQQWRQTDLFVLDDVHSLEGRSESQKQLTSLIDDLAAARVPLVFTSRKSPGELRGFSKRLVNRFHGGVASLVRLPCPESRTKLIEHFAGTRQIPIPAAAIRLLAEKLAVSPRELLATVLQLEVQSRQKRRHVDVEFVRRFLDQETTSPGLSLAEIAREVGRHFGVTLAQLRAKSRAKGFVVARQCAMFLSRELTARGLSEIGGYYGGRDHSTVLHACQRIAAELTAGGEIGLHLGQIRGSLGVQSTLTEH